jgi:alkylhydroperoxidase family enzyme
MVSQAVSRTLVARAAVAFLEWFTKLRWGYRARLMASSVAHFGPIKAVAWLSWNIARYERTRARFGPVRTHLICTTISIINGCEYCTYGHGYALELAYLRRYERLFPLSEAQLVELRHESPAMIRHRLVEAVLAAELHHEVHYLERTISLALGDARPTDRDEVYIAHLVRMFRVLNGVAIDYGIEPDESPTPMNKDHLLRRRYEGMRSG